MCSFREAENRRNLRFSTTFKTKFDFRRLAFKFLLLRLLFLLLFSWNDFFFYWYFDNSNTRDVLRSKPLQISMFFVCAETKTHKLGKRRTKEEYADRKNSRRKNRLDTLCTSNEVVFTCIIYDMVCDVKIAFIFLPKTIVFFTSFFFSSLLFYFLTFFFFTSSLRQHSNIRFSCNSFSLFSRRFSLSFYFLAHLSSSSSSSDALKSAISFSLASEFPARSHWQFVRVVRPSKNSFFYSLFFFDEVPGKAIKYAICAIIFERS